MKTLVLVGPTGNGKSGTGNSILGKTSFKSKTSSSGVTTTCELQSATLKDGQILNLIDTPGRMFDVSAEIDGKEIAKCIGGLAKDGIHAVLVVLSVRSRFSEEEKDALLQGLQAMFGSEIVNYVILVFTGGDAFDEEETFEDYLCPAECPQPLKDILLVCENRFVLFDNKTKDETVRARQVEDLVSIVDTVIDQNGGKPYSDHDLFVELERGETSRDKEEISELKVEKMEPTNQDQLKKITEEDKDDILELFPNLNLEDKVIGPSEQQHVRKSTRFRKPSTRLRDYIWNDISAKYRSENNGPVAHEK